MNLDQFNQLPEPEAEQALMQCCVSTRWIEGMIAARPFSTVADLHSSALQIWQTLAMPDYLEAFEGHPKIGDISSLKAKYASTKTLAAGEQSGADSADEATLTELAQLNHDYEARYGFIFIVCASGKSAAQMLEILRSRMDNSLMDELAIAAGEQAKITAIRLNKMLEIQA